MIRILVMEDNTDFRSALVSLPEHQADLEVAGTAGSLSEAHTILEGVDVVLLDRGGDPPERCDGGRS